MPTLEFRNQGGCCQKYEKYLSKKKNKIMENQEDLGVCRKATSLVYFPGASQTNWEDWHHCIIVQNG